MRLDRRMLIFLGAILFTCFNIHTMLSSDHDQNQRRVFVRKLPGDIASSRSLIEDLHADAGDTQQLTRQQQQHQQQQSNSQNHPRQLGTERRCHITSHAEFEGEEVVAWGDQNLKASAGECCESCKANSRCNVWVYCNERDGCGGPRKHQECWLKRKQQLNVLKPAGTIHPNVRWMSGAVYSEAEQKSAEDEIRAAEAKEADRLLQLKNNAALPLVYFDVSIKGVPIGRMVFVLFSDIAPLASENFRRLCTGENGTVPMGEGREGEGKPYHFQGKYFYRIIDQFIDQTGADTDSTYGGMFKDDPGGLKLRHDRKGLLSAANRGPDTNTSHFSILQAPAPHLNGKYTIFGELVEGWEVAAAINRLSVGKPENTAGREEGAQIVKAGQLRAGNPIVLPEQIHA